MWSIEMHMKQEEIIVKCGSHSRPLLLGRGSRRTAPRRHAVVGLTKVAAYEGAARCLRVNPDSVSTRLVVGTKSGSLNIEKWLCRYGPDQTALHHAKRRRLDCHIGRQPQLDHQAPGQAGRSRRFHRFPTGRREQNGHQARMEGGWRLNGSVCVGGHEDYKHENYSTNGSIGTAHHKEKPVSLERRSGDQRS